MRSLGVHHPRLHGRVLGRSVPQQVTTSPSPVVATFKCAPRDAQSKAADCSVGNDVAADLRSSPKGEPTDDSVQLPDVRELLRKSG
jgi:hypothetical protein